MWMHAPSVGEGLQARPIAHRLRAWHPEVQLAYTYFSPSMRIAFDVRHRENAGMSSCSARAMPSSFDDGLSIG